MRKLELNPQRYDVTLEVQEVDKDCGTVSVSFRFGDNSGEHCFLPTELEKVGKWFLGAAKEAAKA